jgi:hypothetical protein
MKLIDVVEALRNPDTAVQLAEKELPGVEFLVLDMYMKDELDLNSDIRFFDAEKMSGLYLDIDGIKYVNVFPLTMAQELVGDFMKLYGPDATNETLAKRLFQYRLNDA